MNNEEYTPDIVSIIDEDGKEHIFEELDRIETDTGRYVALLPLPEKPDEITEDDNELIKDTLAKAVPTYQRKQKAFKV